MEDFRLKNCEEISEIILDFTTAEVIIKFKAVTNEKAARRTESSQNPSSILVPKTSHGLQHSQL